MGDGPEAGLLGEPTRGEGDSHTVPGAAAGIDYSRVEGPPGALRTTAMQNLICAPDKRPAAFFLSPIEAALIVPP